jgi:hypothetical protein
MINPYFRCHAIKTAKEFDEAMERVRAITSATEEDFKELKLKAARLARETTMTTLDAAWYLCEEKLTKEKDNHD